MRKCIYHLFDTLRLPRGRGVPTLDVMNHELRARILEALTKVENPSAPVAEMLAALRELDAIVKERAGEIPGDLAHYLSRRSYAKARLFLSNLGPIPAGDCGRGN